MSPRARILNDLEIRNSFRALTCLRGETLPNNMSWVCGSTGLARIVRTGTNELAYRNTRPFLACGLDSSGCKSYGARAFGLVTAERGTGSGRK